MVEHQPKASTSSGRSRPRTDEPKAAKSRSRERVKVRRCWAVISASVHSCARSARRRSRCMVCSSPRVRVRAKRAAAAGRTVSVLPGYFAFALASPKPSISVLASQELTAFVLASQKLTALVLASQKLASLVFRRPLKSAASRLYGSFSSKRPCRHSRIRRRASSSAVRTVCRSPSIRSSKACKKQ